MTSRDSTIDTLVIRGANAGIGLGHTLEAAAVRLSDDIAELREHGGIPTHVDTLIVVYPKQRILEIQIEGLSPHTDPDRTTIREVTYALFELASYYNIVTLDAALPVFTQRILLLDPDGRAFHALVGAAVGEAETLTSQRNLLGG